MKKLRIVITSMIVGGAEKQLAEVLPLLAKQGWSIRVVTTQVTQGIGFMSKLTEAGIVIDEPPTWFCPAFLPRPLLALWRGTLNVFRLWCDFRRDPDAITHFFLPEAYLLGTLAAVASHLPATKIMSRRSLNHYQTKYPVMRWLERKWHQHMHIILGNSDQVVRQLARDEYVPMTKLKRIYNGINVVNYHIPGARDQARTALGIGQADLVYIMVANLMPYKGHEDLLHALALVREQLPSNWRLLCVGRDSGILNYLQTLTSSLQLEQHILWLGVRQDIPRLLLAADIGVLCSHQEGFSNAILEGMAAGLPMVVSDVGGNTEAVVDGETGLVVPSKNSPILAQALLKLAKQPAYAKSLGVAGKQRVMQHFSLQACADSYRDLYQSCIGESG